MLRAGTRFVGPIVAGMMLAAGAADAQIIVSNTTRDYTATWSSSTFAGASAVYAGSYAFAASAFSDYGWSLSLLSNAEDLAYNYGGGVTISPSTAPSPPYTSPENLLVSGDGTPGYWGWTYNTAAGAGLPLSYGRLGSLATLNFDVGGFDGSSQTIGYYVNSSCQAIGPRQAREQATISSTASPPDSRRRRSRTLRPQYHHGDHL